MSSFNSWFNERRGGVSLASMEWKGAWISTRNYKKGDIVSNDGAVFIAKVNNVDSVPSDSSYSWSVFIDRFEGEPFIWRGQWSSTFNYQPNDVVSYMGSTYIATATSLNITPDSNNGSFEYWNLMASQGSNGNALTAGSNITIAEGVVSLSDPITISGATFSVGPNPTAVAQASNNGFFVSTQDPNTNDSAATQVGTNFIILSSNGTNNSNNAIVLALDFNELDNQQGNTPVIIFVNGTDEAMMVASRKIDSQTPLEYSIEYNLGVDNNNNIPIMVLREADATPRMTIPNLGNGVLANGYTQVVVADDTGNVVSVPYNTVVNQYSAGNNINIGEAVISLNSDILVNSTTQESFRITPPDYSQSINLSGLSGSAFSHCILSSGPILFNFCRD